MPIPHSIRCFFVSFIHKTFNIIHNIFITLYRKLIQSSIRSLNVPAALPAKP
ncbi:hypothetical protein VPHK460_0095 [Vibrio phage K460]